MENKDKKVSMLKELYKTTDNREISGYIGDGLDNVYYDDNNDVIYSSHHESGNLTTDSWGVVLDNSILIKQIQNDGKDNYNQIFSWDISNMIYSYVLFDSPEVMDLAYDKLRVKQYSLCNTDVVSIFKEIGIKFENISNVLLNQEFIALESSNKKQK